MGISVRDSGQQEVQRVASETPVQRDVTFTEVLGASTNIDHRIVNMAYDVGDFFGNTDPHDSEYEPLDDIAGYEGYANELMFVGSSEEMARRKMQIDQERKDRETLALASGPEALAASVLTAASDPISWIPVAGPAYRTYKTGASILQGAARTAISAAAIETGSELYLQNTQYTRTGEESLMNISAAAVLSGVMGAAASALSPEVKVGLTKAIDEDMTMPTAPDLASVGAAQATTTAEQEAIKGLERTQKFFNKVPDFLTNPVFRGSASSSKVVREITEQMADTSLIKNKNTDFIASANSTENRIKQYDVLKYEYVQSHDSLWKDYRKLVKEQNKQGGIPLDQRIGSKRDGSMTYREFGQQIVKAGRRNDQHLIPQVQQAAQDLRRIVLDPLKQRMLDAELIDAADLPVKTADSWMRRMWDRDHILNNRQKFFDINYNWLKQKRGISQESLEETRIRDGVLPVAKMDTTVSKVVDDELSSFTSSLEGRLEKITSKKKFQSLPEAERARILDEEKAKLTAGNEAKIESTRAALREADEEILGDFNKANTDIEKLTSEIGELNAKIVGLEQKRVAGKLTTKKLEKINGQIARLNKRITSKAKQIDSKSSKLAKLDETAVIKKRLKKLEDAESSVARAKIKKVLKDRLKEIRKIGFKSNQEDFELAAIVDNIIDQITGLPGGRLGYDIKLEPKNSFKPAVGARGSAKARVYDIPDEMVEDFLVNDIDAIMESHIRTTASDVELKETFGHLDLDILKKQVQEDYNGLITQAGDDAKKVRALIKEKDTALKDIEAMWEKIRGFYKKPDDYSAPQHVLERTASAWNYVRLLGGMTVSAIPDMGRNIMVHGMQRTMNTGIKAMMKDFQGFKKATKDLREAAVGLDMALSTTAFARANIDDWTPAAGKIDALTQKVSGRFGSYTLMNQWNTAQKTFSGIITQTRMMKAIKDLGEGKELPIKEIENLASHGIDREVAMKIAKEFVEHGEVRENVLIPNAREWGDGAVANRFRAAVRKQVDEIIVTPGLDKPLWMSRPGWRLVGQFRSFAFASMQRVAMAGLQQGDASAIGGMMMMIGMGSMVYGAKTALAGRPLSDDPRVWIIEGIDRSGITGWFFDVNNIVEKATRGRVGMNALVGGPPMSRYASRNVIDSILGPTLGLTETLFTITGSAFAGDWKANDTHAMRKLFPYQNLVYARQMFDKIEEGVNNFLGVKQ